ncbi:hypothetical protein [Porphyromonas uenonis]|uniref:hypothetical protein n=1 Tax=Porphyromonas uenonis TaxID=281920 RepID=UPI000A60DE71|nr:hypothetical protein [Porphyromonas uenonis]
MKCFSKLFTISLIPFLLLSAKALRGSDFSPIYSAIGEPLVQAPDTLAEEDLVGILLPEIHVSGTPHKPLSKSERYATGDAYETLRRSYPSRRNSAG